MVKQMEFMEKPLICMVDFEDTEIELLKRSGFNIFTGTLGIPLKVKKNSLFLSQLNIPNNLHEFDLVVMDMKERDPIPWDKDDSDYSGERQKESFMYIKENHIFNPIPISLLGLESAIKRLPIKIIFTGRKKEITYEFVEKSSRSLQSVGEETYSTTIYTDYYFRENVYGKNIIVTDSPLKDLITKYKSQIKYFCTYGIYEYHKNAIPLIKNKHDDTVSYLHYDNDSIEIVFPQIKDKSNFLYDLFTEVLPELMPSLFPDIVKGSWKYTSQYYLPNMFDLTKKKNDIVEEYQDKLTAIDNAISENNNKYAFLHNILTESGDELVSAFIQYLNWIGFTNVIDMDSVVSDIKEEDLQIEHDNGLIVIECKGIGGTSKDSDCSQISKIVHRRSRERKKFDVHGIYIVNHQRHLPPLERKNPPFTKHQIKDAENEERGLLTTWELFKLFLLVEQNIISKEQAQQSFYKKGLIKPIEDNLTEIGVPTDTYQNGYIAIVDLVNTNLSVGDSILTIKDGLWQTCKILSLQANDRDVDSCCDGEIGIKLDNPISKKGILYCIKNN